MLHTIIAGSAMRLLAIASMVTLPGDISHDIEMSNHRKANDFKSMASSSHPVKARSAEGDNERMLFQRPLSMNPLKDVFDREHSRIKDKDDDRMLFQRSILTPLKDVIDWERARIEDKAEYVAESIKNATTTMVQNTEQKFKSLFLQECCLPQFDSLVNQEIRKGITKVQRINYQFNYKANVPEAPMLKSGLHPITDLITIQELPTHAYNVKFGETLLNLVNDSSRALAKHLVDELVNHNRPANILQLIGLLNRNEFHQRPDDITSYTKLFGTPPASALDYELDEAFARYRLAGPNPTTIQPCTMDILRERVNLGALPINVRMQIHEALRGKRLFVVDYYDLGDLESGVNIETVAFREYRYPKYNSAPLALFEMPLNPQIREREWLRPLAVQVNRMERGMPKPAIFTPRDGRKWKMAKAVFNSADGDYHEGIAHLAQTHYTVEPFVVSTHRQLPPQHPIYKLLLLHLEGTAWINFIADMRLISPGNLVDHLVNQNIEGLNGVIGQAVLKQLSQNFTFPALIERQQMTKEQFPAPFPYRDDGMLIWNAIRKWVDDYLRAYYGNDDATCRQRIVNDYELQSWVNDLRSWNGARVRWLDSFDNSISMLVDVVAAVIFTGSAHHAAVNYPQYDLESFAPAWPLAMYTPPPKQNDEPTEQEYLNMLPSMEQAMSQRHTGLLLGGLYYGRLGDYPKNYFKEGKVVSALGDFQRTLSEIGRTIEQENKKRVGAWRGILSDQVAANWAYKYLLPQRIPQSINI